MTKLNRNYGKLNEDGVIVYAPAYLFIDGKTYGAPTAEQYASQGWLPIDNTKPEKVGVYFVSTERGKIEERGGSLVVVRLFDEHPLVPPAPRVTRYSKLRLIVAAKAAGKWAAFKAFIAQAGYEDEWAACQFLSSDYAQFNAAKAAIVAAQIATAEEVEAILAASVDEEVR